METTCVECGEALAPGNRNKRYCGRRCNSRAYKRRQRSKTPSVPVKSDRMTMTREDLAWVAGIFEGEGCFTIKQRVAPTNPSLTYVYVGLRISMVDEDIVRRCQTITQLGYVSGPNRPPSLATHQPQYAWVVGKVDEAVTLIAALWPYLGERRRRQVAATMERWRKCARPDRRCFRISTG